MRRSPRGAPACAQRRHTIAVGAARPVSTFRNGLLALRPMKLMLTMSGILLYCAVIQAAPGATDDQDGSAPLTPKTLATALAAQPTGADADRLAERVRADFGGRETLMKGAPPKIDELTVAWAIESPLLPATVTPRVAADVGNGFVLSLTPIGTTGVYAGVAALSHGTAMTWHYEIGDRRAGGGQLEVYETHPDSREQPGSARG